MKLSKAEWLTEDELYESFDDALDQQDPFKIGILTYYPSQILKNCDPIAYRLGVDEYADLLAGDGTFVKDYTHPTDYGYDEPDDEEDTEYAE